MGDHDPYEEPYDPDGDVSRHLYYDDPKPLENDELLPLNHEVVAPQYEINHGVSGISLMPSTENRFSFQQYEYNHRVTVSVMESTRNGVPVQQYEVNHGVTVSVMASTENRRPAPQVNPGVSLQPSTENRASFQQYEANHGVSLMGSAQNGVSVQQFDSNHGVSFMASSETMLNENFVRFMTAALEQVQNEGSSSNPSWQAVFQQVVPEQLNCFNCSILREVLHSSATRTLSFVVHGEWSNIDHATFDYQEYGEAGNSANRQLFYVNLRTRSSEWVRSFIDGCITIMKSDPTGQFHDSLVSFYDSFTTDIDLTMQLASGYHYVEPPSFLMDPTNFEVGESSGTKNESPDQNVPPTLYLPESAGSSSHQVPVLESQPLQYLPPVNTSNWVPPVEVPQLPPGASSPIEVSDSPVADDEDDIIPPLPVPDPVPNGVTPLAVQRRRTAGMRPPDLVNYIHLPINEAANKLRMCSTALKNICRRYKMVRWPSRQLKAYDRQIAKLKREMMSNKKPGMFYKYMEEIEVLQRKKMEIYESVLALMKDDKRSSDQSPFLYLNY